MKKYSFKDINCVYVLGSSQEDFKYFFSDIKDGLNVKEEDIEKAHPKELERIARKKAMEEAAVAARNNGGFGVRFIHPIQWPTSASARYGMAKNPKKSKGNARFANSIFIISGDSGLGLSVHKNQNDIFENFNKILNYNNSFVFFIRGNHDNPEFFDGEKINYSNIKAIPDYSVIETNHGNVLCVGGAISVDREWRKKQEDRINNIYSSFKKKLYCEKEAPFFDANAIEEIVKNVKIDYVVSHSAPSFATPENNGIIDDWLEKDKTLKEDIDHERLIMDKIFNVLSEHNMKPKYWAYGHFVNNHIEKRSNTIFRSISNLNGFNPISIDWDISMFISNEECNKKKLKESKIISKKPPLNNDERPNEPIENFIGDALMIDNNAVDGEREEEPTEEYATLDEPFVENNGITIEPATVRGNIATIATANNTEYMINNDVYERLRREMEEFRVREFRGNYANEHVRDIYNVATNRAGIALHTADVTAMTNDDGEGHG